MLCTREDFCKNKPQKELLARFNRDINRIVHSEKPSTNIKGVDKISLSLNFSQHLAL